MSNSHEHAVPDGFERLPEGLGFNDCLQPVYRRIDDTGGVSAGLVVLAHHTNSMGICHGGVLMTLADMTAAMGVSHARDGMTGSPTINLSVDFIAAAKLHEWVVARAEDVSVKRRFGFCRGTVLGDRGVVARFSGTFYFPDHAGMWKDGRGPISLGGGSGDS